MFYVLFTACLTQLFFKSITDNLLDWPIRLSSWTAL